ncbi:MAG: hypothetical protein HYV52_00605 [Parcubacteria group bacterium]|nr:hypothetical protein [Parcubacteria group bacterium]
MSKQEKTIDFSKEESRNETSGLKKLVKKVLTDKLMRNAAAMSAFVATVASVGYPWGD